jgi:hypothetical protein
MTKEPEDYGKFNDNKSCDFITPEQKRRLEKADKLLRDVLEEVKSTHPQAEYYVTDNLHLCLESSHDLECHPHPETVAWTGKTNMSGGDW